MKGRHDASSHVTSCLASFLSGDLLADLIKLRVGDPFLCLGCPAAKLDYACAPLWLVKHQVAAERHTPLSVAVDHKRHVDTVQKFTIFRCVKFDEPFPKSMDALLVSRLAARLFEPMMCCRKLVREQHVVIKRFDEVASFQSFDHYLRDVHELIFALWWLLIHVLFCGLLHEFLTGVVLPFCQDSCVDFAVVVLGVK